MARVLARWLPWVRPPPRDGDDDDASGEAASSPRVPRDATTAAPRDDAAPPPPPPPPPPLPPALATACVVCDAACDVASHALPCGHCLCDRCQIGCAKAYVEGGRAAGRSLRCPALVASPTARPGLGPGPVVEETDAPSARCPRELASDDLLALTPVLRARVDRARRERAAGESRSSSRFVRRVHLTPVPA